MKSVSVKLKSFKELQKILKSIKINDTAYFTVHNDRFEIKIIDFVDYNGLVEILYYYERPLNPELSAPLVFSVDIQELCGLLGQDLEQSVLVIDEEQQSVALDAVGEKYEYHQKVPLDFSPHVRKYAEVKLLETGVQRPAPCSEFETDSGSFLNLMKLYSKTSRLVSFNFDCSGTTPTVRVTALEHLVRKKSFQGTSSFMSGIRSLAPSYAGLVHLHHNEYGGFLKNCTEQFSKLHFEFFAQDGCLLITPRTENTQVSAPGLRYWSLYLPLREAY